MFLLLLFLFFNNIVDVVSLATMKTVHAQDLSQLINSLGCGRTAARCPRDVDRFDNTDECPLDASDEPYGCTNAISNSELLGVRFDDFNLKGTIPNNPCDGATTLEVLSLRNNEITGSLSNMGAWGCARKLIYLDVSVNLLSNTFYLKGIETDLEYVNASHNQFTLFDGEFNNADSLKFLSLAHNQIESTVPDLPSTLTHLDLSHNKIPGTMPSIPSNVEHLNLANNSFTGTLPTLPSSLTFLDISNNEFIDPMPTLPASLRTLIISDNKFAANEPPTLPSFFSGTCVLYNENGMGSNCFKSCNVPACNCQHHPGGVGSCAPFPTPAPPTIQAPTPSPTPLTTTVSTPSPTPMPVVKTTTAGVTPTTVPGDSPVTTTKTPTTTTTSTTGNGVTTTSTKPSDGTTIGGTTNNSPVTPSTTVASNSNTAVVSDTTKDTSSSNTVDVKTTSTVKQTVSLPTITNSEGSVVSQSTVYDTRTTSKLTETQITTNVITSESQPGNAIDSESTLEEGTPIWVFILIAIGGVCCLLLIIGGILLLLRRKSNDDDDVAEGATPKSPRTQEYASVADVPQNSEYGSIAGVSEFDTVSQYGAFPPATQSIYGSGPAATVSDYSSVPSGTQKELESNYNSVPAAREEIKYDKVMTEGETVYDSVGEQTNTDYSAAPAPAEFPSKEGGFDVDSSDES